MKRFAIKLINSPKCILYRYEINQRHTTFQKFGVDSDIHTINVTSLASAQNDANTQVMRLSK